MTAISLAIIIVLSGFLVSTSEIHAGRTERTLDRLQRIEDAMIQFVAVNGRLPCPANGALDTGIENPADPNPQNGTATCATLVGTVPWHTLGISEDIALDAWNQKISYRMFHGATGLTQTGGASMTDCDLYDTGLSKPLPANGLCETATHDNTAEQFLFNKGLTFDNKGNTTSGIAFVLISHGPTGNGAFLPGGNQKPLPNAANVPEWANAANDTLNPAQRTFYARDFSDSSVSPADANHFDDLTRFIRIDELIRKAARGPRNWSESADEVGFDETTTANMTTPGTGHFLATGNEALGQVFVRGSSPDIVTLGNGSNGQFSACLWWPSPLTLYIPPPPTAPFDPATIKSFRMAVDFSFPDASVTSAAGLVVGFISHKTPPDINTCGTNSGDPADADVVLGDLGWGGGNFTTNNRFGVEIDINAQIAAPYTDPANNHVAFNTFNTYHAGTAGPVCPGPNCTTTWLRDGTTNYHRLRIELEPISAICGGEVTFSPQLRIWIMPHDVCTANPEACMAMRLQDPYFITQDTDPTDPTIDGFPPGTVYAQSCLPSPSEKDAYHSIYFGFTSAKTADAGYTVLNLKQLQSGVY